MGLSSTGIGSQLPVEEIVSKLVAVEKQPLDSLTKAESSMKTQLSVFSQVKSLTSTLSDSAAKLAKSSAWDGMLATSSNSAAVSVNATGATSATSFSIDVQQLARGQSVASGPMTATPPGLSGTLSIDLGKWSDTGSFTANASNPAKTVSIDAGDSLSDIAKKINDQGAGVTATVLRDASGERLLMRSSTTGEKSGFRIQVAEDAGASGLSRLSFDPKDAAGIGMAANTAQYGRNAKATINGIEVQSKTNTFTDTIPGLSFTASQVTTAPVEVAVTADTEGMKKNIQDFVNAYNALNDLLSKSTAYDAETKTAGALQGDSTSVGLQNAMRSLIASTTEGLDAGAFTRLADIGIDIKKGGKLEVSATKLDKALKDPAALKAMFANTGGSAAEDGLAVKVKAMTSKMLGFEGLISNKSDAINASLKRNSSEQDKVKARAAMFETRLRAQYMALDVKMGSLNGLSAYIGQQVSQWNSSGG